ncbi:MAG: hypothetical protein HFI20_03225 [Lachnospiraceae bacterium]|jgi:hypothetical protein|nr:hypothetical protein [Lachnospiraceae bacterium]MCI9305238.1 hypothetical protein [Lachnospiraceae bacterium]
MGIRYDLSVSELMDFFCVGEHCGFSEREIEAAEKRVGVSFPDCYRRFLLEYGKDNVNTRYNQMNTPEEIFTSYEAIRETLEEWEEEFEDAKRNGGQADYADNEYFTLWQLSEEEWGSVTENYLLIWAENQGVWNAGYLVKDLQDGVADPPVYMSTEDDFVTFKRCADSTDVFLKGMLGEAAYGYHSKERYTKLPEIEMELAKRGIDTGRLEKAGNCLDTEMERLYFYAVNGDYRDLIIANRREPDKEELMRQVFQAVQAIPKPRYHPYHLRLTDNQEKDLGMKRPRKPGGIAVHPIVAFAMKEYFNRLPLTAYDWGKDLGRMKTLKLEPSGRTEGTDVVYIYPPSEYFPPEPYYYDLHDWSIIGKMAGLRTLAIENIFVDDFSFLRYCKNVRRLSLYGTNFSDCRLLLEMPNLKEADLHLCPLEHEEILDALPVSCRR